MKIKIKQILMPTLSLFTSTSTLFCCALPALMVTLGLGATLAGAVSTFPMLNWIAEHKEWTFLVGGMMLALAGYLKWRARKDPCPLDEDAALACKRLRRMSNLIYFVSVCIYLVGFFFAFVAIHVL